MDKIIEDAEYLTIGKKTFDVSNVPAGRKKIAQRAWDTMVTKMNADGKVDGNLIDEFLETYGRYLIIQPLSVLTRRMTKWKAIKSYIARHLLTIKYIRKTNETEYDLFTDWSHYKILGTKKKELKQINQVQKMELKMLEEMEKLNLKPEQLTELLQTFLVETVGNMNTSAVSPKVS